VILNRIFKILLTSFFLIVSLIAFSFFSIERFLLSSGIIFIILISIVLFKILKEFLGMDRSINFSFLIIISMLILFGQLVSNFVNSLSFEEKQLSAYSFFKKNGEKNVGK